MRAHRVNNPIRCTRPPSRSGGTILMEVILALGLFMVTGAVVCGAFSSSFRAVDNVRLQAEAADLAVTKLSEIQIGQLEPDNDGPNAYEEEDLEDWTWEIAAAPLESDLMSDVRLLQVEIVITNTVRGTTYRLVQLMPEP